MVARIELAADTAALVERYDSRAARARPIARGGGDAVVSALHFDHDGEIGPHEAGFDQIFLVTTGVGWIAGADHRRLTLHPGEAALVRRGEIHGKGGAAGTRALMLQMPHLVVGDARPPQLAPTLIAFGGLPGSGKTTLARMLAADRRVPLLRIDTIEQRMREAGTVVDADQGYRLAGALAADQLRLGMDVIADSVNPLAVTREAWAAVAKDTGARLVQVEIRCSDPAEHRRRVETRHSDVPGLALPDWAAVQARTFEPWDAADVSLDTAGLDAAAAFDELVGRLDALRRG